jgi:hypothetical protein
MVHEAQSSLIRTMRVESWPLERLEQAQGNAALPP